MNTEELDPLCQFRVRLWATCPEEYHTPARNLYYFTLASYSTVLVIYIVLFGSWLRRRDRSRTVLMDFDYWSLFLSAGPQAVLFLAHSSAVIYLDGASPPSLGPLFWDYVFLLPQAFGLNWFVVFSYNWSVVVSTAMPADKGRILRRGILIYGVSLNVCMLSLPGIIVSLPIPHATSESITWCLLSIFLLPLAIALTWMYFWLKKLVDASAAVGSRTGGLSTSIVKRYLKIMTNMIRAFWMAAAALFVIGVTNNYLMHSLSGAIGFWAWIYVNHFATPFMLLHIILTKAKIDAHREASSFNSSKAIGSGATESLRGPSLAVQNKEPYSVRESWASP